MKAPSWIGQNNEIMPKLRRNALSQIGQGHETIRIICPSNIEQSHDVMPELYRVTPPPVSSLILLSAPVLVIPQQYVSNLLPTFFLPANYNRHPCYQYEQFTTNDSPSSTPLPATFQQYTSNQGTNTPLTSELYQHQYIYHQRSTTRKLLIYLYSMAYFIGLIGSREGREV